MINDPLKDIREKLEALEKSCIIPAMTYIRETG
jgi:hypothetical protein